MKMTRPRNFWWIFAILCRVLGSYTHSHWFHPDEWCQTLEPANYIAHGFGFHSQEIGLHLRNLSWPFLLAGVLKLSHAIAPLSIDLRVFLVNLLCGSLDLFILWGWIQLVNHDPLTRSLSSSLKNWSVALLLLPWFAIYESMSPRGEHLSEIAFWLALGCMMRKFWTLTGIACVAIFAFRYPSALLSIGICLSVFIQLWQMRKDRPVLKPLKGLFFGLFCGLILFGLPDGLIYGRPWESFWMYLQYNIFTGTSARVFGQQGFLAYREPFLWNWATYKILIPFSLFVLMGFYYGFWNGLKRFRPWALCLAIYLLGHCLVPHKEGRFMIPIETLTRWAAFVGLVLMIEKFKTAKISPIRQKKWRLFFKFSLAMALIGNSFIFLHALRADFWKDRGTYREVGSHLLEVPHVCGIITVRDINSTLMPFLGSVFPVPALGSIKAEPSQMDYVHMSEVGLTWFEKIPLCSQTQNILLHVHKAESEWFEAGCSLLPSGVLRVLPRSAWIWALKKKIADGAWYRCPSDIIHHFKDQKAVQLYSRSFGKIKTLPRLGGTAEELEELGHKTSPPPQDAYLPSLARPQF